MEGNSYVLYSVVLDLARLPNRVYVYFSHSNPATSIPVEFSYSRHVSAYHTCLGKAKVPRKRSNETLWQFSSLRIFASAGVRQLPKLVQP